MLFEESKWYSLFGPFETSGVTRAHAIRPVRVGSVERTDGREEKNNVRPETWTRRTYRPARSNFIPEQTREVERRAKWKWPTDTCPLLSKEVPRILSAPFTVSLRSPPRRNDAGHPCRGFPLRYRLLPSPPYRSKPGVDKCVDHRICVPAAFYEEKPR